MGVANWVLVSLHCCHYCTISCFSSFILVKLWECIEVLDVYTCFNLSTSCAFEIVLVCAPFVCPILCALWTHYALLSVSVLPIAFELIPSRLVPSRVHGS